MSTVKAWLIAFGVVMAIGIAVILTLGGLSRLGDALYTAFSFLVIGLLMVLALASLIAVPVTASNKGRNPLLWFIAAWFLSLWAWAAVWLIEPIERPVHRQPS